MLKKDFQQFFQSNLRFLILLLLGTISWSLVMFKSGLVYDFGMGFWGPNGHDGVWHIALAKSLARGSWEMPTFAGSTLQNYHIGFDLFLAALHKATTIPVHVLYFQIIPPIIALLTGLVVYKFVFLWRKSKAQAFWATFFVYFGGSFGWIITLLRKGELGGESMFWSQQAISTLINPPFALSILLIFLGLILLLKLEKSFSLSRMVYLSLIFGILIQIKVYAGLLMLGGLLVVGVYKFWKKKKAGILKVFGLTLIISILLFLPLNKESSGTLVFKPFWFLEVMMSASDRVYWPKFAEAMVNYRFGHVWIKAIVAYVTAFLIFWYGNMGTRFMQEILFAKWIKNKRKLSYMEIFLLSVILAGIVLPMFFLQEGTPWNTIQFFYYSLTFSGIFAGIWLGELMEKGKALTKYFIAGIVLLTLPTTIGTLKNHYLLPSPPAKISSQELEALRFLEKQPDGVVLTYPFENYTGRLMDSGTPRQLGDYESTAYVSAFGNKSVFLEDEVNLDITGYDWKGRREEVFAFLKSLDEDFVYGFLRQNNISYIYWLKGQHTKKGPGQLGITRIFENSEVDIYEVD